MDILRITVRWTGFQGAPGYSNFHFTVDAGFWDGGLLGDQAVAAATTAAQRVADALEEIRGQVPSIVQFAIEPEATILDSDSGETMGVVQRDDVQLGQPNGSGSYAGPVGAVVNWNTSDYRFGRRIRGRTFLVPLSGGAYEADGTLNNTALAAVRGFADVMVGDAGGPEFGVWSRPRNGAGGVFATVTNGTVPDMAAVLRSRRD